MLAHISACVNERKVAWNDELELDWNSPLFNMVTIWRSKLSAGQSRAFDAWWLHPVTFEPKLMRQIYTNTGREMHQTQLGAQALWHYTLDFGGTGASVSHLWCDDDSVVFDFQSPEGGYRLMATDL